MSLLDLEISATIVLNIGLEEGLQAYYTVEVSAYHIQDAKCEMASRTRLPHKPG